MMKKKIVKILYKMINIRKAIIIKVIIKTHNIKKIISHWLIKILILKKIKFKKILMVINNKKIFLKILK